MVLTTNMIFDEIDGLIYGLDIENSTQILVLIILILKSKNYRVLNMNREINQIILLIE